ncbi:MAG: prolyl oligopeptidase family serine peptidase [Prosthecobacter sp.]
MKLLLPCLALMLSCPPGGSAADEPKTKQKTKQRERSFRHAPEYQKRVFKGSGDSTLSYAWLPPLKVEAGRPSPLVICLHGSGGNATAGSALARAAMRDQYPAFVMVPEAESPSVWAMTEAFNRRNRPADTPEKLPVLIEAVRELMKTEAVDPARIYITGQSLGGIGSWGAIAQHPEIFAAAVPVCGAWAVEDTPKMTAVPVWAFHGEKDNTVPVLFSRELTAALTKAGGTVKYTEYPDVGHDSWLKAYEDVEMWRWLFAQHKSATK